MSQKIEFTKAELKTPDKFLQVLNQAADFFSKNMKMVLTVLALVLVVGGGIAVYGVVKAQTENKLLEAYYQVEKKFLDKKKMYDDSAAAVKAEANKKPGDKAKAPEVPKMISSGDVSVDYAENIKEMTALMEANPSSQAGQMAALLVADLYRQGQHFDQSLATVEKVTPRGRPSTLLSALVLKMKGNVQADLGQCDQAINSWKQVVDSTSFDFMDQDLKVKMGLCFEKSNDLVNAEKMYQEASSASTGASAAGNSAAISKEAEKYLRLLQAKKQASGT